MRKAACIDETGVSASHLKFMGRDALNLVEFPLATLADRAPKGCKTLVFEDRILDRGRREHVTRRLTISGSDRYGLPTSLDDEVIVGLLQLTKADNFASRRVQFNRYGLIRVLGWRDEGKSYARLEKSLQRWPGVTLYYENAWWDKGRKQWLNASFHLLDEVVLRRRSKPCLRAAAGNDDGPSSYFTWNEIVFRSFQAGCLKGLDLDFYRNLKLPTSKRLYRFLDKRFHFSKQLVFDLGVLAREHVGLSRNYDAAQLRRRLTPAIEELEEAGYLVPMPVGERYCRLRRGEWRIAFVRAPKAKRQLLRRPLSGLERRLVDRGVAASSAVRLVRDFPADQIQSKIDAFDVLSANGRGRAFRNAPGYLVQSIRDDYAQPAGCVRAFRPAGIQRGHVESDAKGRNARQRPTGCGEEERVRQYLSAMPADERTRLEEDALAKARGLAANGLRRAVASGRLDLADQYRHAIVQQYVRSLLEAPTPTA